MCNDHTQQYLNVDLNQKPVRININTQSMKGMPNILGNVERNVGFALPISKILEDVLTNHLN